MLGIDVARGKYLGFVDSDDYIEKDMYEVLYDNIVKEQADLSICGVYDLYASREPKILMPQYMVLSKIEAMKMILEAKLFLFRLGINYTKKRFLILSAILKVLSRKMLLLSYLY